MQAFPCRGVGCLLEILRSAQNDGASFVLAWGVQRGEAPLAGGSGVFPDTSFPSPSPAGEGDTGGEVSRP